MVVIAIVGGLVAMAMPYVSNRNTNAKKFLRQIVVLSRDLHTKAKLHGVTYRIVFDLGDEKDRVREQKYWVEKSNAKVFLRENEEEEELKRMQELREDPENAELKKGGKGFEMDPAYNKEPKEVPSGMIFDRIELARLKEPVRSGRAYIHYMPEGLVDEAALQLKGEGTQAWTISIHPLTGKAELTAKPVSLKELKQE